MIKIVIFLLFLGLNGLLITLINPFGLNEILINYSVITNLLLITISMVVIIAINIKTVSRYEKQEYQIVGFKGTGALKIIIPTIVFALMTTMLILSFLVNFDLLFFVGFIALFFLPPALFFFNSNLIVYNQENIIFNNLFNELIIPIRDVKDVKKFIFKSFKMSFLFNEKVVKKMFFIQSLSYIKSYSNETPNVVLDMINDLNIKSINVK